ncbi:MAG: CHASE domain-containing protein [bacterium]
MLSSNWLKGLLKRYGIPSVVFLLGVFLSVAGYYQLRILERQRLNDQFNQIAANQSNYLQGKLNSYRNALHSTVDLFNSGERITAKSFRKIARVIQERYPRILSIEWLPRVEHSEREDFTSYIHRRYDQPFAIKVLNDSARLIRAPDQPVYYPVTYSVSFKKNFRNEEFIGFDHYSLQPRRLAIRQARDQGSITITPSMTLPRLDASKTRVNASKNNLGIVFYKPVFTTGGRSEIVRSNPEHLDGVIALSLRLKSLLNPIFSTDPSKQNVAIFENHGTSKNPSNRLVYTNKANLKKSTLDNIPSDFSYSESFPVSNGQWTVLLWPNHSFLKAQRSWAPLIILLFGLLLTGVFSRGAYSFTRRYFGREAQFESVIDSARDGIISVNEKGDIVLWNQAASDIFGYDLAEVIGEPIIGLIADSDESCFDKQLNELLHGGSSELSEQTLELTARTKDDGTIPIVLTVSAWFHHGETYLTLIARDISERKAREEELRELTEDLERKVEQRTRELEQFVYAASHDLREPARIMQNYAEFLEMDLGEELSESVKKDLDLIQDSARQMNELIDSLLKLSRIRQDDVHPELVSLEETVTGVLDELEERLSAVDPEIVREELPDVKADSALIRDLYKNLITNALDYGYTGSDSFRITFTAEENESNWILGVSDNGAGIDPEFQEKIFEPFTYLRTDDESNSTGIGLSICRRIVKRHDGEMWVESEPCDGAHFRFTIPKG